MPLNGTGLILGAALKIASGADATKCNALGQAIASWLLVNCRAVPGLMVAGGTTISGHGAFAFTGGAASFGLAMFNSVQPLPDATGLAKWQAIAQGIIDHMNAQGYINPSGYAFDTNTGNITGNGSIAFSTLVVSPSMAVRIGVDAIHDPSGSGVSHWQQISDKILGHIRDNATVPSLGLAAPPGGGAVTGSAAIS